MINDLIHQYEELKKGATPGPWKMCSCGCGNLLTNDNYLAMSGASSDARLICFLHNNADAFVEELKRLQDENEALQTLNEAVISENQQLEVERDFFGEESEFLQGGE